MPQLDSASHNLITKFLIPELIYLNDKVDFYIPTQHQGIWDGGNWTERVRARDLDSSDAFFQEMPKKYVIVHALVHSC